MLLVPLAPLPNQKCAVRIDGVLYELTVRTARRLMVADVARDGAPVVRNVRCLPLRPLIPYRCLESGNFVFVTAGEYPHYSRFGAEDELYHLSAEELEAWRSNG
jgi:hypothetical protein